MNVFAWKQCVETWPSWGAPGHFVDGSTRLQLIPQSHLYFCYTSFKSMWAKHVMVPYFHVPPGILLSFFLLSTLYNPMIVHIQWPCLIAAHSLCNYQSTLCFETWLTLKMGVSPFWVKCSHDQPLKVSTISKYYSFGDWVPPSTSTFVE